MGETKGHARKLVGWATGDRQVEAEGRIEESKGEIQDPDEVEAAKEEVKREHGDLGPTGERSEQTDR